MFHSTCTLARSFHFDTMVLVSDTREIIFKHLAPGLGCVIAFLMFVSPLKATLQARKDRYLGDLNPLPMVAIIANTTAWLLYGCIARDPYVVAANEPGLLLGVFMSITAYGYAEPQVRDNVVKLLMFFTVVISSFGIYIALAAQDKLQIAGYLAVGVLLCYYSSPLTTLTQVLTSHNSSSLHWPLSIMSTVNGSLWLVYGLATGDYFIWAPNAVGAALGVLQLLLIAIFPSNSSKTNRRFYGADAAEGSVEQEPLQGGSGDNSSA